MCENEKEFNGLLQIWKVAIDTQMHFNDLLIRMRTTVISIILAVFGASAIAIKDFKNPILDIHGIKMHISSVVLAIGIMFLFTQYIIDRFYYFKLLLGAVDFTTEKFDKKDKTKELFGLTDSIIRKVSKNRAENLLTLYYAMPVIIAICVIYFIQSNLEALVAK